MFVDLSGLQSHNHNSQQLAIYSHGQQFVFFFDVLLRLIALISGMTLFIHHHSEFHLINTATNQLPHIYSLPFESLCGNSICNIIRGWKIQTLCGNK